MQKFPTMDEIRIRIRAALDAKHPELTGLGLARALDLAPSQITSLLKPGGRELRIDEIPVVENYLGIRLFDLVADPPLQSFTIRVPVYLDIEVHAHDVETAIEMASKPFAKGNAYDPMQGLEFQTEGPGGIETTMRARGAVRIESMFLCRLDGV